MSDWVPEFAMWWHEQGSAIIPLPQDDMESHARRVGNEAWNASNEESAAQIRALREALEQTLGFAAALGKHSSQGTGGRRGGHIFAKARTALTQTEPEDKSDE